MLTLTQLSKQYRSKSGHIVHALDNINITFPGKGIVFILGASGSGKSTLLNIIGGLDTATSGEMKILDKTFVHPKENQLNQYRNRYVGFIFQDFNLINDLTVYDNLRLACFVSRPDDEKKQIADALQQVGLQGYESRYPSEVSGGEFQRIAIARAMLKDCRILLADEPTGNLNTELSHQVFDTLKAIAATRLVIVVTHNEELAKQYGERIIRLKDGKIIEDSQVLKREPSPELYDNSIKNKLPNKVAFKIANKTIVQKKVRMFFNFLALVLGFSLLVLSYAFVFYDRPYVDYKNIIGLNDTHFAVTSSLRQSFIDDMSSKYDFDYIQDYKINSIETLIDMGYQLKPGYQELSYDGIVLNTNWVFNYWVHSLIFNDEAAQEDYTPDQLDYTEVIGKYIRLNGGMYKICGVIDTKPSSNEFDTYTYDNSNFYNTIIDAIFCLPNSQYADSMKQSVYILESKRNDVWGINVTINQVPSYQSYNVYNEMTLSTIGDAVVNQNGIVDLSTINNKLTVNDPQGVYISLDIYNQIFHEIYNSTYYVGPRSYDSSTQSYYRSLYSIPSHIGETFTLKVEDRVFNEYHYEMVNYQVLGVIMSDNIISTSMSSMVIPTSDYDSIYDIIRNRTIIVNVNSISDQDILSMFRYLDKMDLLPVYSGTNVITKYSNSIQDLSFIILVVTILSLFSILLSNVLFINQSIKSREKEITILKSIGIRRKDITKIFFIQVGVVSCISWILSSITSAIFIRVASQLTIHDYNPVMNIVLFNPLFSLYLFIFIFVINFLSTLYSIINFGNRSLIYTLRNNN